MWKHKVNEDALEEQIAMTSEGTRSEWPILWAGSGPAWNQDRSNHSNWFIHTGLQPRYPYWV